MHGLRAYMCSPASANTLGARKQRGTDMRAEVTAHYGLAQPLRQAGYYDTTSG
jgi:hypothetical protein